MFRTFGRFLLLTSLFSLLPGGVGYLFLGKWGALVFFGLGIMVFLGLALRLEDLMEGRLGGTPVLASPIREVLFKTLEKRRDGIATPRISLVPDPGVSLLVCRGLGGKGVIFVTQGLVSTANDRELGETFTLALDHLQARGMVTRGLAALAASLLVGWAPRQWVQLVFKSQLGPSSAERGVKTSLKIISGARFFVMFPYITFLVGLSRPPGRQPQGERRGVSNPAGGQWRIQQDVGLRNLYIQI